ncbi:hypothetical protein PM082_022367 [Marasmius tenuissimus]|nr:hypothetical protein PM082_022367 [Marasmius tenuissimus]
MGNLKTHKKSCESALELDIKLAKKTKEIRLKKKEQPDPEVSASTSVRTDALVQEERPKKRRKTNQNQSHVPEAPQASTFSSVISVLNDSESEAVSVMNDPEVEASTVMNNAVVHTGPTPGSSMGISRTGHSRFFPQKYRNFLPNLSRRLPSIIPHQPTPPPTPPPEPEPEPLPPPKPAPPPPRKPTPEPVLVKEDPDDFGVYRVYSRFPATIPDEEVALKDVQDGAGPLKTSPAPPKNPLGVFGLRDPDSEAGIFAPFLNATVFRLMNWFYSLKGTNSIADLDSLVNNVILADDFDRDDLVGFWTKKELERMDEYTNPRSRFQARDGWIEGSVKVQLPAEKVKCAKTKAPEFTVPDVFYRKPLEVIKTTLQSEAAKKFHFTPFKSFWQPPPSDPASSPPPPVRIISELYNSDAFLEEYDHIQLKEYHDPKPKLPPRDPKTPTIENAVVALLWWSDSTHIASFGDASLWPLYLFFGNQSKYDRAKPTTFSAHHMAYIPTLPNTIQEFYREQFGFPVSGPTLTHLNRELMHAVWALILDEEFMHAYEHGVLIECADGIIRHIFPRFFTYSADYPEKVLLTTLKQLSRCPCPQCFVQKDQIPDLGTVKDRQRMEKKP